MKTPEQLSSTKKKSTLALGLLAALIIACSSVFQFSVSPIVAAEDRSVVSQPQGDAENLPFGTPQKADNNTDTQRAICKIQAMSPGVQLQVAYVPLVWESLDIALPEFKVEIPKQLYKAGWEYFRVLFTDIIAPNAP